jgi:hypothetical protein
MLAATVALIGIALMLLGDVHNPIATAQSEGAFWINDSFKARGGQGIYELTTGSNLKLLIPYSQIKKLNSTQKSLEIGVTDIAQDSRGQILLLDLDGEQILKATSAGNLSLAAWLPTMGCPISMAIDPQGNYIIGDNCLSAIFRVKPDGVARLIAPLPPCPGEAGGISIVVDQNGDYIVAASQASGGQCRSAQLLRIKPSGETTVILDVNTNPLIRDLSSLVKDPSGQGYYALSTEAGLIHISPSGQVRALPNQGSLGIKGQIYGMTTGPTGDLVLGTDCFGDPRPECRVGVYEIALDGSRARALFEEKKENVPLVSPQGIEWIAK